MPTEYDWETRITAEELYITGGMTYDQVSDQTLVSVSQLKRWGSDGNWVERRKEYRQALSSYKRDATLLRMKLVQKAMEDLDPQLVYAVAAMDKVGAGQAGKPAQTPPQPVTIEREINTPEDAVEALQDAVERKLNRMLTQPGELSLTAVNELKKTMELIEGMKARYAPDKNNAKKVLDADAIRDIREQLKI